MELHKSMRSAMLCLAAAGVGAGCGSDVTNPGDGTPVVTLSVQAVRSSGQANLSPAFNVVLNDGANTLTLTRVAVVLREIELERQFEECSDDGIGDSDSCEEFETGPVLLEVPLDGSVTQVITVPVPPGIYDELEFDVHKLDDEDPASMPILLANPELDDVSIWVEGTFNGVPFVFRQDLNEEQEIELVPPLIVEAGAGPTDLTLLLDVTTWFVRGDGSLIDPTTANKGGANEDLVEDNIKDSIDLFDD